METAIKPQYLNFKLSFNTKQRTTEQERSDAMRPAIFSLCDGNIK